MRSRSTIANFQNFKDAARRVRRVRVVCVLSATFAAAPLAGATLAACAPETLAAPPAPPIGSLGALAHGDAGLRSPSPGEKALAEMYVAALSSASAGWAPLALRLDDDVHFTFPGAADVHGKAAVMDAHEGLFGAFDARVTTTERVWRSAHAQAAEWTMSGSQERDWRGVTATHKAVAIRCLTVFGTNDDGSITDIHLYFDVPWVRAELGVGPKDLVTAAKARALDAAGRAGKAAERMDGDASVESARLPEVHEATGSADEKRSVDAAHAALDALEGANAAAYESALADDIVIDTPERLQPLRGKADAHAYFSALHKAIGELDTTVTDAWGVGPFAIVEYTISGEQQGPLGWIPFQRDKGLRLHIADIVQVVEGKLTRVWRYGNLGEIVGPPPT